MKKPSIVFLFSFVFLLIVFGVYNLFQNKNLTNLNQQEASVATVKPPVNHAPVGSFEAIASLNQNFLAQGWTVDPDTASASISVEFYLDGKAGAGGVSIGKIISNTFFRTDVYNKNHTYTANQGFSFTIPTQYADGKSHKLYAYGIDSAGGPNTLLSGSPKTFKMLPATYTITASADVGGSISPSGTQILPSASNTGVANFIITPVVGYKIDKVIVDGKVTTSFGTYNASTGSVIYIFKNISANHTISVTFKAKAGTVTTSTTTPNPPVSVIVTPPSQPTPTTPINTTPISYNASQPFIPASMVVTNNISSDGVTLAWPQVTDAVGYGVYLDNTLLDTTTNTSYDATGILMPDTDYTISVESLTDLSQAEPALTITPSKTTGFFASLWSGMLVAAGISSQPPVISSAIHTSIAPPVPLHGTLKILTILPKFIDSATGIDTIASVQNKLDTVANYYRETSFGKLQIVEVIDSKAINLSGFTPSTSSFVDDQSGLLQKKVMMTANVGNNYKGAPVWASVPVYETVNEQSIKDGYNPNDYDLVVYVWPKVVTNLLGIADSIGPVGGEIKGRVWINGVVPAQVYAHEIGHKLGFHHADAIVCAADWWDCANYQGIFYYAGTLSVMGHSFFQLGPYDKSTVDWLTGQEITQSGRYSVVADELSQSTAMHFKKTDTGDEYYLDYRQPIGTFDGQLSTTDNSLSGFSVEITKKTPLTLNIQNSSNQFVSTTNDLIIGETLQIQDAVGLNHLVSPVYFTDGNIFNDPINHVQVIQISHDTTQANVFVRLDTTTAPVVSAVAATVNNVSNLNSLVFTGKVAVSWTAIPTVIGSNVGYELYRDSTTTPAIYSGSNISYTDTVSPGTSHLYYVRAYDSFPELPGKKYYMPFSQATYGGNSFGIMQSSVYHYTNPPTLGMFPMNSTCSANATDPKAKTVFYDIANTPQYYVTNKPCSTFNLIEYAEGDSILTGTIKILPNGPTIYYDQPGKGTGYSEYFFDANGVASPVPIIDGRTGYYFNYPATGLEIVK